MASDFLNIDGSGALFVVAVLAAPFVAVIAGIVMILVGAIRRRPRTLRRGAIATVLGGLGIAYLVTHWDHG